jgi:carbonic anhydrase
MPIAMPWPNQSPESFLARRLHQAQHPTALVSSKCMDGRMNLSVATGTPPGIITPFRNLGGCFDLGWPYFGKVLAQHVESAIKQGRRTLVLIMYYYSKGVPTRAVPGFSTTLMLPAVIRLISSARWNRSSATTTTPSSDGVRV